MKWLTYSFHSTKHLIKSCNGLCSHFFFFPGWYKVFGRQQNPLRLIDERGMFEVTRKILLITWPRVAPKLWPNIPPTDFNIYSTPCSPLRYSLRCIGERGLLMLVFPGWIIFFLHVKIVFYGQQHHWVFYFQ